MIYSNIRQGYFLSRPNRFIAEIEIDGKAERCHVKNTGRCRELLTERAVVYVQEHDSTARKTKYSLIAVRKEPLLINMDSQAPNKAVAEWLQQQEPFGKISKLKAESVYGSSRFDFYLETVAEKVYLEVKGVTLEQGGVAMFPDAPTERGIKHLQELMQAKKAGYKAVVIFVVQMRGMKYFTPNAATHPAFAEALRQAAANGVEVLAVECEIRPDSMEIYQEIPVRL